VVWKKVERWTIERGYGKTEDDAGVGRCALHPWYGGWVMWGIGVWVEEGWLGWE